jgi:hypothetical protein
MKTGLSVKAVTVIFLIGSDIAANATHALAEDERKNPAGPAPGSYILVSQQQITEDQAFAQRQQTLRSQPAGPKQNDLLRQEYQRHLETSKKLSLEKQAARQEVIRDLKNKWSKVESDWKSETVRHDSALKEIEKMPEGPARETKLREETASHRTRSKQIAVERNVVHEGVLEQANREAAGGSNQTSRAARQTAGTKVTDPNHRGMNGDFDAGGGYRTTEKAGKILNEIGVKSGTGGPVRMKNGVLETSADFGMTINADAGADKIGSAGHQAQVKTGAQHGETYVSETGGAVQSRTLKDHLAILDHTKKAMHGLNESPDKLVGGSSEGQVMAKGTLKAADQAGLLPETVEAIAKQNGIKDPRNFMDRLADIKAGRSTIASPEEAVKMQGAARDILKASESSAKAKAEAEVTQKESKISDFESQGKRQEAQKMREELADYRAKSKAQGEALNDLAKGHPAGEPAAGSPKAETPVETSGKAGASSEPPAKTGKIREPSEKIGAAGGESAAPRTSGVKEPVTGVKTEPEPATPGGSRVMRGAGIVVGVYGIYEGYQTAAKEMQEKMKGEPKTTSEWTANKAELVGRTLWHGFGFGTMAEIGKKAGEESFEQYKKDIADGKISKDSMSAYAWMKARGVMGGLFQAGKAITYDAAKQAGTGLGESVKEGGGLAKDTYGWLKNAGNEKNANAQNSKQVYETLIKKGASPVGAQRAADAVKNGDFSEAKRLNKVLDAKLAAKALAAQKTAEAEPKTVTRRDRKKQALKREARKQEEASQKKSTDNQLKFREIVIGKLRAKNLPTGADMVDRLVGILERDGMPALDAAIADMTGMQGTFEGSIGGQGALRITIKGRGVTGTYANTITNTVQAGDQTMTFTAHASGTITGDVELSSGSIAMKMTGSSVCRDQTVPISAAFSGGFTGKGYKGSTSAAGVSSTWAVSREG